ncbi:hemolysin family protein [soil metagenome]
MNGVGLQVVLVLALIVLNAAFAGSEIALISLRETQLQRLQGRGPRGRTLAHLARDPNRFLATIQIGITLAGFLASAVAAVSLAQPLVDPLSFLGDAARPTAVFLVTLLLTFLTLVLGELAPKRIAMQHAEGWGLLAARPLQLLGQSARPAVWILERATDIAVRVMGADPAAQREELTDEELRDLVSTRPGFTRQQRTILEGAFEIAERMVRDVAVNRLDVVGLSADTSVPEATGELKRSGHSRAPVYRGDLDHVVGVVHLRDMVDADGVVGQHTREAMVVPETLGLLETLRQLRSQRQHMAIVIDEHGSSAGIVTLEDILEELVGEIYDEFDTDVQEVHRRHDGSLVLAGSFPMHDLPDLDVSLPPGPYTTIAGLILHRFGRLPSEGEGIDVGRWRLTVGQVEGRTITQVQLQANSEDTGGGQDA